MTDYTTETMKKLNDLFKPTNLRDRRIIKGRHGKKIIVENAKPKHSTERSQ